MVITTCTLFCLLYRSGFLTPPLGVIPCEYPDKLTSPETRGIVLPDAENRTIVSSFVWTQYRNVTDRQTESL